MAIDKKTRDIINFLRDMQGSRRYKLGVNKLSSQYRQDEIIKKQLTK